jgi:hypothetical protein
MAEGMEGKEGAARRCRVKLNGKDGRRAHQRNCLYRWKGRLVRGSQTLTHGREMETEADDGGGDGRNGCRGEKESGEID